MRAASRISIVGAVVVAMCAIAPSAFAAVSPAIIDTGSCPSVIDTGSCPDVKSANLPRKA